MRLRNICIRYCVAEVAVKELLAKTSGHPCYEWRGVRIVKNKVFPYLHVPVLKMCWQHLPSCGIGARVADPGYNRIL
jgi:hypothetical protein